MGRGGGEKDSKLDIVPIIPALFSNWQATRSLWVLSLPHQTDMIDVLSLFESGGPKINEVKIPWRYLSKKWAVLLSCFN